MRMDDLKKIKHRVKPYHHENASRKDSSAMPSFIIRYIFNSTH